MKSLNVLSVNHKNNNYDDRDNKWDAKSMENPEEEYVKEIFSSGDIKIFNFKLLTA